MSNKLAYSSKYALNAICPYFTMFPLEYPFKILNKHKNDNPVILDPFCGRGTTLYAAREFGYSAWGIDTSPIAVAIAQAKLASASKDEVLKLARKLIAIEPKYVPESDFFHKAYSKHVLRELCSLREGLLRIRKERGASILLRAAALGCLHGPLNKTKEGLAYFSNQMPRTFSTKPDYSVRYWKNKGLKAPRVNIIDVLDRKLTRIVGLENQYLFPNSQVICSDSIKAETYNAIPEDVSLVITSPPYYGMKTYIQDQWLRNWFLGGAEEVIYENDVQLNHNSQDVFIKDLASVWRNISARSNTDELRMYIRFGSIPSVNSNSKEILVASLEEAGGWQLISTRNAKSANAGKRQAQQMLASSQAAIEYDFHVLRS